MPGISKKIVEKINTQIGTAFLNQYGASLDDAVYSATQMNLPLFDTNKKLLDTLYENSKQNSLRNGKTLILEKDFYYKDQKGKEIIAEDGNYIYHSRTLYYKQNLFFLLVMFSKPFKMPQEVYENTANYFFESFEILNKPA